MKTLEYVTMIVMALLMISCQQPAPEEETESAAGQEEKVAEAADVFIRGIEDADRDVLDAITADGLSYGHSNGRVQNKTEFLTEIVDTAAFDFVTGEAMDQTIEIVGETAIVRHIFSAETSSNGTPGSLKLGMILIWQHQDGAWKLIARQAYRLPE